MYLYANSDNILRLKRSRLSATSCERPPYRSAGMRLSAFRLGPLRGEITENRLTNSGRITIIIHHTAYVLSDTWHCTIIAMKLFVFGCRVHHSQRSQNDPDVFRHTKSCMLLHAVTPGWLNKSSDSLAVRYKKRYKALSLMIFSTAG